MLQCTDLEELVTLSYCEVFWVPLCWLHLSSNLLTNHGFIHGRTDQKNNEPWFGELMKPVMYRKQYPYGDLPCAVEMEIAGRKGSKQITTAAIQSTIASVKPGFCRLIRICKSVRSLIDKIRCEAM